MGNRLLYVSNDDGKTFITLANLSLALGTSVIFDIVKDCTPPTPIEMYNETVTLQPKTIYSTRLYNGIDVIRFDGISLLTNRETAMVYSLDNEERTKKLSLNEKISTIYITDTNTKETMTLTNVKYDPKSQTVTFDMSIPAEQKATLTAGLETSVYVFPDGGRLVYNATTITTKVNYEMSFDGGINRKTEYSNEPKLFPTSFLVRNKAT